MAQDPILIVDGHTHITNRVYWEKIDPWKPQAFGFDYSRAYDAAVRVVIENISPYGYNNFNYTPKQILRLIETFHQVSEQHSDRMGIGRSYWQFFRRRLRNDPGSHLTGSCSWRAMQSDFIESSAMISFCVGGVAENQFASLEVLESDRSV